jgi:hypothetical protein
MASTGIRASEQNLASAPKGMEYTLMYLANFMEKEEMA